MANKTSISKIFQLLRDRNIYREWTKTRIIKIVLGNSVIRVFEQNSKKDLVKSLSKIPVDQILSIANQEEYDKWHWVQVSKVYNALKKRKKNIKHLTTEGLKWGHSTKIFNLFIGHLIFYSPYFKKSQVRNIVYFLHVPLDKKVFDALRTCGIEHIPSAIKYLNRSTYRKLQKQIREGAGNGIALHFDEYAWAYDKES